MKVTCTMNTKEIEISNNAKVCYASKGERNIIPALMARGHKSTLRFAFATFNILDISIPCHVQMLRSKHLDFLVQSKRYCNIAKGDFKFIYPPNLTVTQRELMKIHWDKSIKLYSSLIDDGVHKEDARSVLPANCSTELNVTSNLQGWSDFQKLRISKNAQSEVREVAIRIAKELSKKFPLIFNDDELFDGVSLRDWYSSLDIKR